MESFSKDADVVIFPGDCLEMLKGIPDGTIHLTVTSPPYNIGKSYEKRLDIDDYRRQQEQVIRECHRVTKDGGSICWQVGNFVGKSGIIPLDTFLFPIFISLGLNLKNRIIWHFEHGLHCSKRLSGRYETIMWFTKGKDYYFDLDPIRVPQKYPHKKYFKGPKAGKFSCNPKGKNPGDVWSIPNVKHNHVEKTIHPCQFPVELVERLVLGLTKEGDWVLDPFMGVGSTAVAAIMNKRRAIGAEIIPEYVEIAWERVYLAQQGKLKTRPMDKPVYDSSMPPQVKRSMRDNQTPFMFSEALSCQNRKSTRESK